MLEMQSQVTLSPLTPPPASHPLPQRLAPLASFGPSGLHHPYCSPPPHPTPPPNYISFKLFTSLLFFNLFQDFVFLENFGAKLFSQIVCEFGLLVTRWHLKLHNLPHVSSSSGTSLILNPIWLRILTIPVKDIINHYRFSPKPYPHQHNVDQFLKIKVQF